MTDTHDQPPQNSPTEDQIDVQIDVTRGRPEPPDGRYYHDRRLVAHDVVSYVSYDAAPHQYVVVTADWDSGELRAYRTNDYRAAQRDIVESIAHYLDIGEHLFKGALARAAAVPPPPPPTLEILHDSTGRWYFEAECDDGVTRWFIARDRPQRAARPAMPVDLRFRILERDGFRCHYCGRGAPEVTLHVDHVQSVADGGGDDEANLTASCRDCNLGKGKRSMPPSA